MSGVNWYRVPGISLFEPVYDENVDAIFNRYGFSLAMIECLGNPYPEATEAKRAYRGFIQEWETVLNAHMSNAISEVLSELQNFVEGRIRNLNNDPRNSERRESLESLLKYFASPEFIFKLSSVPRIEITDSLSSEIDYVGRVTNGLSFSNGALRSAVSKLQLSSGVILKGLTRFLEHDALVSDIVDSTLKHELLHIASNFIYEESNGLQCFRSGLRHGFVSGGTIQEGKSGFWADEGLTEWLKGKITRECTNYYLYNVAIFDLIEAFNPETLDLTMAIAFNPSPTVGINSRIPTSSIIRDIEHLIGTSQDSYSPSVELPSKKFPFIVEGVISPEVWASIGERMKRDFFLYDKYLEVDELVKNRVRDFGFGDNCRNCNPEILHLVKPLHEDFLRSVEALLITTSARSSLS